MSDQQKEAAIRRGEKRSAATALRVHAAMEAITSEIKDNGGIYPHNGGAVSMNEVSRRAGIHLTTLHTNTQHELGEQVKEWIASLKSKEIVGKTRVRRSFQERAEDWKARYLDLESSHIKTEFDLQQAEAERDQLRVELEKLRQDYSGLLAVLGEDPKSKVTPIGSRKK
jgi:AraC-like DNA-binding protein